MSISKDLRIVYMGTPEFAVEPLRALLNSGFNISAVVTVPDKPAGRGQKLSQSAVKQFAVDNDLRVIQPQKLKEQAFVDELTSLNPDIFIVVAFRMLPQVVWNIPSLGTFNLHASLLPNYRGAAPINWAVINGETKTGLTTFLIDEKIDTGKILLNEEVLINPDETAGELHDKLMPLGGQLVVKTVELLASNQIDPKPQDNFIKPETNLKQAPKLFKENTRINWSLAANEVHNVIRGLSPYPSAWCFLSDSSANEVSVKIFRTKLVSTDDTKNAPGTISTDGKTFLHVQCGKGIIAILELQLAGKKSMPIKDFLLGFRDIESCKLK